MDSIVICSTDVYVDSPLWPVTHAVSRDAEWGFTYLYGEGGEHAWPGGVFGGVDPARYLTDATQMRTACVTTGISASDMAVKAAASLLARLRESERTGIDLIVYCHSAIDQDIASSPAARLQHELGLARAFPFSISQVHASPVFTALSFVSDLLRSGDFALALIVAADRWLHPYPRCFGPLVTQGDGAGAMLVRADAAAGYRIIGLRTSSDSGLANPYAWDGAFPVARYAQGVVSTVQQALSEAQLTSADIDVVLPSSWGRAFVDSVSDALGFEREKVCWATASKIGCIGSADLIAALHDVAAHVSAEARSRVLAWGAGLSGQFGCMIAERR